MPVERPAPLHLLTTLHGVPARLGTRFSRRLRQVIESVNDTFKGQLHLGHPGGHTPPG